MCAAIQQSLFADFPQVNEVPKPINVASVPQRSPFRYPGGKTWFVPTFRAWLANRYPTPAVLVEPFAGGGIISLTALFEDIVSSAVMVEIDEDIAAVWQSVVEGHANWLARRIQTFDLTEESLREELSKVSANTKERAFQTILKNRTFHGGILAEGSGLLKTGENGKGIRSRWYPATLARRLNDLTYIVDRIKFRQEDGLEVIREYSSRKDAVFFIDPPYTAGGKSAGKRLYRHFNIAHDKLFLLCKDISGDFLMTYDNADEVKELARRHGFQMRLIPMNNTHHATMEELVIGKDLTWMDQYRSVHEPKIDYLRRTPMAELKTKLNDASVEDFLNGIEDEQKRDDCFAILKLMKQATKAEPKMWGSSIVGFGSYHYKGASGREGDWMLAGFSPRKQNITLYIMTGFDNYDALLKKLGKHSTGKSCLYIKRLADVDTGVLKELVAQSVAHMKATNPPAASGQTKGSGKPKAKATSKAKAKA